MRPATTAQTQPRAHQGPRAVARRGVQEGRPVGFPAFLGLCIVSFGGPLALAALYAPTIVDETAHRAGFVTLAGAVVFGVPLLVWLRYSRDIADAGGLYSFVRAAVGPRVAGVQAAFWITSYALYLTYTTASIVYETLPAVIPGVRPYRSLLEMAIPVALAATMLAGRSVTLAVVGVVALGQMGLLAALAAVTMAHGAPAGSFGVPGASTELGNATGQVALLYVCGSLPLFLGGEVARPTRTVRSGLVAGYALTAAGVAAAVYPLAANPAFTRAAIPGVSVAEVFGNHSFGVAVGIGVAASIGGVMLAEFLALSRLVATVTRRPVRPVVRWLAAGLVLSAPLTLISPQRIYDDLLKPSLIALWLSQLIVFAVFPRYLRSAAGLRRAATWLLAAGGVGFAVYGIYATTNAST